MTGVAGIVLAAGRGTRFGAEPKLLARLDGKPLVRHALEAALGAGLAPVILVTGHRADDVERAAALPGVTAIRNAHHAQGLSTSLKAGFSALPSGTEAAVVLLGDMPLVGPGLLVRLLAAWREAGRPAALVPTVDGRRGNPVLLSRALEADIARLEGDRGAGLLLRGRSDVVEWAADDPALAADVDDRASLERLQASTTPSSTAP